MKTPKFKRKHSIYGFKVFMWFFRRTDMEVHRKGALEIVFGIYATLVVTYGVTRSVLFK